MEDLARSYGKETKGRMPIWVCLRKLNVIGYYRSVIGSYSWYLDNLLCTEGYQHKEKEVGLIERYPK